MALVRKESILQASSIRLENSTREPQRDMLASPSPLSVGFPSSSNALLMLPGSKSIEDVGGRDIRVMADV